MSIRYPEIELKLSNTGGNAFSILGKARKALEQGEVPEEEIQEFEREAMSANYDNLLRVCQRWLDVY